MEIRAGITCSIVIDDAVHRKKAELAGKEAHRYV
jgi:hypothetical protein